MTKTVTNFNSVKMQSKGGLFPHSPALLGLPREVHSNQTWTDPAKAFGSDYERSNSGMVVAKPQIELSLDERTCTVLHPRKILRDVDETSKMYKKYSAFRQQTDMNASKTDYKHYLERMVREKPTFDFNMNHTLNQQKKILAFKNRELAQRACALQGNRDMDLVHQSLEQQSLLRIEVDNQAKVRVAPDQFNYRSPKKYTPISTFVKDLQQNRIFSMDGKM